MTSNLPQAAIHCQNLSRRYGEIEALKSLDLTVPAGSIFGFLGRNGAGKTTTIRLLTGLARPSSGVAWVAGVETTRADSGARRVFGYLPQDPSFYNWMTPREYLDFVGQLFGLDDNTRRRRTEEMLELVDLKEAGKRRIGGFSGGMIQRLGIAQALVHEPPVLFLDEPTSALDPAGRYAVLDLIRQLRGKVTVFLSSHILGDVERVCDTVGIIREGELLLVADRDQLMQQYASDNVELEFDHVPDGVLGSFVQALNAQPWIAGVNSEGPRLRLTIADVVQAQRRLLPLIVDRGLPLRRYEWVRPSLEEIFLTLSA